MKQDLTRGELLDMRSVLERSLQRAEHRKRLISDPTADYEAEQLARAVKDLNDELAGY
jgi:hypothetical protein